MSNYECYVRTLDGDPGIMQSAIQFNETWGNQGTRLPCGDGGPCYAGFAMAELLKNRLRSHGAPIEGRSENCAASHQAPQFGESVFADAYVQRFDAEE